MLFEAAGLPGDPAEADDGFVNLTDSAAGFVTRCRQLRYWDREFAPARGPATRPGSPAWNGPAVSAVTLM